MVKKATKATKAVPKKDNRLLITIIVGVVVIIGVVILAICLNKGNFPASLSEYVKAVNNREAVNCTIESEGEEGTYTVQANDGWGKIRMIVKDGEGEVAMETLMIKGDMVYVWSDSMAMKNTFTQEAFDEMVDTSDYGDEDSEANEGITIKCIDPKKADFSVPNKEWIDMSQYGDE